MPLARNLLQAAALTAVLAVGLLTAVPAVRADEKVTIMVGGYEKQIYLPAKLAESLGYFRDEGLDVELLNEPAGVDAENEMLAGAVQGVVGHLLGDAPVMLDLCVVAHAAQQTVRDARSAARPSRYLARAAVVNLRVEYVAVKNGLKPGEFTSVPVGAGNTFIAAMQQDKIQAGMTTEPTITRLLKTREAKVLIDMRTIEGTKEALGGTYPAASLYMPTAWVEASSLPVVPEHALDR